MLRRCNFLLLAAFFDVFLRTPEASPVKGTSPSSTKQTPAVSITLLHGRMRNVKSVNETRADSIPSYTNSHDLQATIDGNSVDNNRVPTSAHFGGNEDHLRSAPILGTSPIEGETVSKDNRHQIKQLKDFDNTVSNSKLSSPLAYDEQATCELGTGNCGYGVKAISQHGGTDNHKVSPGESTKRIRTNSQHVGVYNSQESPDEPEPIIVGIHVNRNMSTREVDVIIPLTMNQRIGSDNQGTVNQDVDLVDSLSDVSPVLNISIVYSPGNTSDIPRKDDSQAVDGDYHDDDDHHRHHNRTEDQHRYHNHHDDYHRHHNHHEDHHRQHHSNDPLDWLRESIPGEPGVDYPIFYHIPTTSFECDKQQFPAGIYGDMDTQCQVFHVCQRNGRRHSFLCPNGTIFNQQHFACDWWYNYKCADTMGFYARNENIYQQVDKSCSIEVIDGEVNGRLMKSVKRVFNNQTVGDNTSNGFSDEVQDNSQAIFSQVSNKSLIPLISSTDIMQVRNVQQNILPDEIRVNFAFSQPGRKDSQNNNVGGFSDEIQRGQSLFNKSSTFDNQQPDINGQLLSHDNRSHEQASIKKSNYVVDNSIQSVGGDSVPFARRENHHRKETDVELGKGTSIQEFIKKFRSSRYDDGVDHVSISELNNGHFQPNVHYVFHGNSQYEQTPIESLHYTTDSNKSSQPVIGNIVILSTHKKYQKQGADAKIGRRTPKQKLVKDFVSFQYDHKRNEFIKPEVNSDRSQQTTDYISHANNQNERTSVENSAYSASDNGSQQGDNQPHIPDQGIQTNSQHIGTYDIQVSLHKSVQPVMKIAATQNKTMPSTYEHDSIYPSTVSQRIGSENQKDVAQQAVQIDSLLHLARMPKFTTVFTSGIASEEPRRHNIQATHDNHHDRNNHHNYKDHHDHNDNHNHQDHHNQRNRHNYSNDPLDWLRESIPGEPGVDYPVFYHIPPTPFECNKQEFPAGIYGDTDSQCQVFHVCQRNGRRHSFLCPNGTIFNQQHFACDWWYNYQCADTLGFYARNKNIYQEVDSSCFSNAIDGEVNDELMKAVKNVFNNQTVRDNSSNGVADKVQDDSQVIFSPAANESSVSSISPTGIMRLRDVQQDIHPDEILFNSTLSQPVREDSQNSGGGGHLDKIQRGQSTSNKSNMIDNQQFLSDGQRFPNDVEHGQISIKNLGHAGYNSIQSVVGSNLSLFNGEEHHQKNTTQEFSKSTRNQDFLDVFESSQNDD